MLTLSGLRELYRRQVFSPSLLGIFLNPFYLARTALRSAMVEYANSIGGRLLDVGCGTKPYEDVFFVSEYVRLDIDSPVARQRGIADYFYGGKVFPFAAESKEAEKRKQEKEHVF